MSYTYNMNEPIGPSESSEVNSEKQQLQERGREIVLNAPVLYVDVDIEADGKAGHGSMLSIGAQSPTGESFYREIKPISEDYVGTF